MAASTDSPAGVTEVIAVHKIPAEPDPHLAVLLEIRDELVKLRELIHDAIVGEMIES